MWDPAAIIPGGDGLDQYTPFVQKLADLSVRSGRPVLLLNGDSHVYESDTPLADPSSATSLIHHTQAVPNLTRITVEGSTGANEWVKLTFYKVDRARTRHAGGTGLGLAIAKHLVEGYGGRLWADSASRHGSTFNFTLPVA